VTDHTPSQKLRKKRWTIGLTEAEKDSQKDMRSSTSSLNKADEADPGLVRRSMIGLKQLFKDGAAFAVSPSIAPDAQSSNNSHLSPNLASPPRKHRVSRVFTSVVSRFKRNSGVALSNIDDAIQDDTVSEVQDSEDDDPVYDDAYSDDGVPDDHEHDRRNFLAIRSITRETIEDLLLNLLYPDNELNSRICRVTHRKEGSFHHAVFLAIEIGGDLEQEYLLKIPAHGTPQHWRPGDGFMLENEARLMQHILYHTQCPVPEVVAYDESLNNEIGAPYILMKKIEGIPALDFWLGKPYKMIPDAVLHLYADNPSPELEQKRLTLLRSLAQAMSELASLKFREIGIPVFSNPKNETPDYIGSAWRWHSKSNMQALTPIGPFKTSKDFFTVLLNDAWNPDCHYDDDDERREVTILRGVRKILDIVLDCSPFSPPQSPKESFVLRHDDLDLQNIFVYADGNVTGIIDWDSCFSVPACIGYTSLPTFLRRDLLPDYSIALMPHMTWAFDHYRDVYAEAMEECIGEPEAKFTRKSALYLSAVDKASTTAYENCVDYPTK
jgi:hypothetical protein